MDQVIGAAGSGIEKTFDYGLGVTVLVLVLVAGGVAGYFLIRALLDRCDANFKASLDMHGDLTNKVSSVVEKNTAAYYDMREQIMRTLTK